MAKQVLTNAYVSVNGVDLSDHVSDVTLDMSIAAVPVTAMGDGGVANLAGLESGKIDITFWQDFASGKVDATLIAIRNAGTAVAVKIAANGTAISATNPSYTYQAILTDYPPVSGAVGAGMASKCSFVSSGTVTRGTT